MSYCDIVLTEDIELMCKKATSFEYRYDPKGEYKFHLKRKMFGILETCSETLSIEIVEGDSKKTVWADTSSPIKYKVF